MGLDWPLWRRTWAFWRSAQSRSLQFNCRIALGSGEPGSTKMPEPSIAPAEIEKTAGEPASGRVPW